MNPKVSLIKCLSYEPGLVYQSVKKSIDLLGGISEFVKPGARVLVKPNLLMAKPPESGITTHPEVLRAVIKVLKEVDCEIFVGDGPSVWGKYAENTDEVYNITGIRGVCEDEGVSLVKFEKKRWRKTFPLTTWLDECDCLINIPKFKTHGLTLLTGAVKNLFGLVSGTFKTELHKKYFDKASFAGMLVDILEEAKPALTIVDGITAMEAEGPGTTGKLRNANILVAGSDCVAIDSILATIMGVKPADVLSIKEAAKRGLGAGDISSIQILGERLEDVVGEPFELPPSLSRRKIPEPIINFAKKLIKFYPCVERDNCIRCAACIKSCPNKAMRMKNKRVVIDYSKCISCFCCQEICPSSAIKIKKSLLAKLLRL